MFDSKVLIFVISLTFSLASSGIISRPHIIQENGDFVVLPEERSVNVLSVQLPQNKPERETYFQVQPAYIPVPIKDIQANQILYHNSNPNLLNFAPLSALASHPQLYQNPTPHIRPAPAVKYPYFFIPSEFSSIKPSNLVGAPQLPIFIKYPEVYTEPTQLPQENLNLTQILPELLNGLTFYSAPQTQTEEKKEHEQGKEETNKEIEANIENIAKEPIIIVPDTKLPSDPGMQKQNTPNMEKVIQSNLLLQNLLQKLTSQRRLHERIGAIYLRDSLLNRK